MNDNVPCEDRECLTNERVNPVSLLGATQHHLEAGP